LNGVFLMVYGEVSKRAGAASYFLSRGAILLGILLLALPVVAWRDISGNTINPKYVSRIKDGQTKKHEILLLFGDPQQVERAPEGQVFRYVSYKDAPALPSSKLERQIDEQSTVPFYLDEDKKIKRVPLKKEGKILRSTLIIRFKPDGETVLSHEYKEY
jgi:outer membrane protein assembly factor BamE (lipoprotein component of BamABCDE complex)